MPGVVYGGNSYMVTEVLGSLREGKGDARGQIEQLRAPEGQFMVDSADHYQLLSVTYYFSEFDLDNIYLLNI